MEGKLNRLYLLTISDRGYIWGKVKQNHQENNKDIPRLLNDKGYSYSTTQSYVNFSQACEKKLSQDPSLNRLLLRMEKVPYNVFGRSSEG